MKFYQEAVLFTLFHHNINYKSNFLSISTDTMLSLASQTPNYGIKDIADSLLSTIMEKTIDAKDSEVSLTLTGGMDSRVILACLLKVGIKPNCFTYGNPKALDVICAKKIAEKLSLNFHNACQKPPTKDWYLRWVIETINRDYSNSHLHRAHRTAAIAEHTAIYHPKILFTGHMGGEGIRGLSYNNYFSSPFFELVNENKMDIRTAALKVLDAYFINLEYIDLDNLLNQIMLLPWMNHDRITNRFYFLYELVAKIHHAQEIRLYQSYVPQVITVFLDENYLRMLFSSTHNFMNKTKSIFGKLMNPYAYCKIIEYLYPKLLDFPLANGFTPKEYLKGLGYYVPFKLYRQVMNKYKHVPSFSYGKWFKDFVCDYFSDIDPVVWGIYSKEKYFNALDKNIHSKDEGYWYKFSNPIYLDLVRKYQNESSYFKRS